MARTARALRRTVAVTLALTAVLFVSGCGETPSSAEGPIANFSTSDDDGMHGAVLTEPYTVPDVALSDTAGEPYSLSKQLTDPLTLVFFGYTHCPDICQVVMADIASSMTRLDDSVRSQVGMVFITSDPARDDAATLRTYLDRFDPSFEGLTGSLGSIVTIANELGVQVEKGAKLPSGGFESVHGTQIIGVRDDGTAPIVWTEGTSAAQLAEDITELVAKNGSSS